LAHFKANIFLKINKTMAWWLWFKLHLRKRSVGEHWLDIIPQILSNMDDAVCRIEFFDAAAITRLTEDGFTSG